MNKRWLQMNVLALISVFFVSCNKSDFREFSAEQNSSGINCDKILLQQDGDSVLISTVIKNSTSREFRNIFVEVKFLKDWRVINKAKRTLVSLGSGQSVKLVERLYNKIPLIDIDTAVVSFKIPFILGSSPITNTIAGGYGVVNTQTVYHPFGGEMKRRRTYEVELIRKTDSTMDYSVDYYYSFEAEQSASNPYNSSGRNNTYNDRNAIYEKGRLQLKNTSSAGITFTMSSQNKHLTCDRLFVPLPRFELEARDTLWLLEPDGSKQILFKKY